MVLALQSFSGFERFGATSLVGTVVALSITRELGPVFAGLMVSGRVGASMAAELGTMKVTEQIDALVTLATDPVKYLVVPRVIAATVVLPILVVFADFVGILGGYFVAVHVMGANPHVYVAKTYQYLEFRDIYTGLVKAAVFGSLIALISCHNGFVARGGAEGVGGRPPGGGDLVHDGARLGLLHDLAHVLTGGGRRGNPGDDRDPRPVQAVREEGGPRRAGPHRAARGEHGRHRRQRDRQVRPAQVRRGPHAPRRRGDPDRRGGHHAMDEEELVRVRRRFGMLFQGAALFDSMDVGDNVGFALRRLRKFPEERIREVVEEKLSMVGLREIQRLMPAELSGGMKKRVGLARAIASEPDILLYD
jgi:energy-coupling factor transporter ATP-binding protein EcfA2